MNSGTYNRLVVVWLLALQASVCVSITHADTHNWSLNELNVQTGELGSLGNEQDFREAGASAIKRLFKRNYLQLDLAYTKFKDEELIDFTAYYIHRNDEPRDKNGFLAFGYKRQKLNVFTSDHAILRYQDYQNAYFTIAATLGFEDKNLTDDYAYGSLYLRFYPTQNLMLQSGLSVYDSFRGDSDKIEGHMDKHIEWQPGGSLFSQISVFYQESVFNKRAIGIRYRPGRATLASKQRRKGILPID